MSVEQNGTGYYDQVGKPVIVSREAHVDNIAGALTPEHFEVFAQLPRKAHRILFETAYLASVNDPEAADKAMLATYNKWFCDGIDPEDETVLGELAVFSDAMPMHIGRYVSNPPQAKMLTTGHLADVVNLSVRRVEAPAQTQGPTEISSAHGTIADVLFSFADYKDATPTERKAFAERAGIDLSKDDAFMMAYHPPKDWQNSEAFKARFDDLTAATIERAVRMTRLTEANANFIKSRLGLPVVFQPGVSKVPERPLEYLRAIESSTPGRLARAQEYPRIGAMTTALRLFTNDKLPVDGVIAKFGNNPEAGLLLKGAIVEVMLANMQVAAKNKIRYEQP